MEKNKANSLPILLSTEVLIRFSDCDPFNHLNNSKYIDYFLNAREDQLLQYYDLDLFAYSKTTGCAWVVGQHKIAYLKPAFTMEKVIIESTIVEWNTNNVLVEFKMWNSEKTKLKSLMWTYFHYYNLATQKSEIHPEEINAKFKVLENTEITSRVFEERILQFKK
ncbi:MAG TPA: acyl-CoA thioesterase [Chitinophagales bacterium]|nr:acyl-CoA thioesterase [Chitinophagales bacterium]